VLGSAAAIFNCHSEVSAEESRYRCANPECEERDPSFALRVTHSLHTSKTGSLGQTDSQIKKSVVATVFAELVLVLVA